jgi:tRNA dimethylallyltransferase
VNKTKLPIIIGPTASGKTRLAAFVAKAIDAEIISADSRQVYRGMDLGTGKDYEDYIIDTFQIPYHLIDIVDAGYKYNLFEFQQDFKKAFIDIKQRLKQPLVCGGTGLYVESIIKNYSLYEVPEDSAFRNVCELRSFEELVHELEQYKTMHNKSDLDSKKRLIRALEIARFETSNEIRKTEQLFEFEPVVIGVDISRDVRRNRIETRLKNRITSGMIEEVEKLISQGVSPEVLIYYGLEYKFLTQFVTGIISRKQMEEELCIAIFQFAKRQMTWFRGMERRGIQIHWINGELEMEKRVEEVLLILNA